MKLIDLSVPLNEKTPIYPGDLATKIQTGGILEKDGYKDHYVCIGTHVGTHIDAPAHMVEDGKTLNQIPIEKFTGRGVYIKIEKEFNLEEIRKTDIQENDIVLFHTGMSDAYHSLDYYEKYPAITENVAQYLVEKKVKMIGVDMCSPDYTPFPVHKILLQNGILIIENLTNLKSLIDKNFTLRAFPIKLEIDGAPARVIAEIE